MEQEKMKNLEAISCQQKSHGAGKRKKKNLKIVGGAMSSPTTNVAPPLAILDAKYICMGTIMKIKTTCLRL
jgi:hypothetical protein